MSHLLSPSKVICSQSLSCHDCSFVHKKKIQTKHTHTSQRWLLWCKVTERWCRGWLMVKVMANGDGRSCRAG
ncbi:hypothetical protein Hanom_Chr05g00415561 [Helianthus anomalus]